MSEHLFFVKNRDFVGFSEFDFFLFFPSFLPHGPKRGYSLNRILKTDRPRGSKSCGSPKMLINYPLVEIGKICFIQWPSRHFQSSPLVRKSKKVGKSIFQPDDCGFLSEDYSRTHWQRASKSWGTPKVLLTYHLLEKGKISLIQWPSRGFQSSPLVTRGNVDFQIYQNIKRSFL